MVVSEIGAADAVRDQLVDVIAALPVALGAFDAKHVELALDVAEDEIRSGHLTMLSQFLLRETDAHPIGDHERVAHDVNRVHPALEGLEGGRDIFCSLDFR